MKVIKNTKLIIILISFFLNKVKIFEIDFSKKTEIKIKNLLKYFDDGHDIMIFADKTAGSFLRKFVTEFGVDFDDHVIINYFYVIILFRIL